MKRANLLSAVLLCSTACLAPLTSDDLAALDPSRRQVCDACGPGQVCDAATQACVEAATLSGGVVSACTRVGISARVSIGGASTCSADGKAYFRLTGLPPGGPQRLSAGKEGYEPVSMDLSLDPGFNTLPELALTPVGGCGGSPPADVACTCQTSNCQP